jgi:Tol biopolymer transport system component
MDKAILKLMLGATGSVGLAALTTVAAMAMPPFGDWSAPADIESLPGSSTDLNTASIDGCASISPDGLTLAFNSFRTGNQEIYLATRTNTSEGFGDPVMLPATINTSGIESCPTLTHGKRLYFTRTRGDPGDLFVSKLGPNGWSEAQRLGPAVNHPTLVEESVSIYEDDEGREVMVFSRRPAGPLVGPGQKIYESIGGAPATLVAGGPHSSSSDSRPSVTHDGKAIFWDSLRSGGPHIWYATRSYTSQAWNQAIQLGHLGTATRPNVSWDGETLMLGAASDIHFATREKATGN